MKTNLRILTLAAALCAALALPAFAAEKHDHEHKATPKGGRLLDKTEQAMDQFTRASQTVEQFFGDQETQQALRETRVTMRDFRSAMMRSMNTVSDASPIPTRSTATTFAGSPIVLHISIMLKCIRVSLSPRVATRSV